jgi:hypothetical protein
MDGLNRLPQIALQCCMRRASGIFPLCPCSPCSPVRRRFIADAHSPCCLYATRTGSHIASLQLTSNTPPPLRSVLGVSDTQQCMLSAPRNDGVSQTDKPGGVTKSTPTNEHTLLHSSTVLLTRLVSSAIGFARVRTPSPIVVLFQSAPAQPKVDDSP